MTRASLAERLLDHRYLVLAAIAIVVYVVPLARRDLWYPDEPDIAEVCKAMFDSGDWVSPRSNGEIWIDYFPMLYWAGSAAGHLLGTLDEFALRLPGALGAVLLAFATCAAGSRWYGPRAGLWSGLLLMTFLQYASSGVSYRPDMLFSLWVGLGVFSYARAFDGEQPRWGPRVLAFVLFGFAILVKGPLGVLMPGLVLTCWHATRREWLPLVQQAPLSLLSVAVTMPWILACGEAMGWDSFLSEIRAQNLDRFEGGMNRGHEKPWHYYLTRMWADFAPWSPLLPFAGWWFVASGRHRDRNGQLLLWWFGATFVFLTIATTKRQVYLLPAYPALALLLAPWFASVGRPADNGGATPDPRPAAWFGRIVGYGLPVVGIGALIAAAALGEIAARLALEGHALETSRLVRAPLVVLGVTGILSGIWIVRGQRAGGGRTTLDRTGFVVPVLLFVTAFWLAPAFAPGKSYVPACEWIRAQIGTSTHIGMLYPELGSHKFGAFGFYTDTLVDYSLRTEADIERFFAGHPDSVVLVEVNSTGDLESDAWRQLIVRDLVAGRRHYHALERR